MKTKAAINWLVACRMMIIRGLTWCGILAIVILSVVPANERPVTGGGSSFEHLAAFGIVAALFAISYCLSLRQLFLIAFLFCGTIELMQLPVPTRHARLSDFIIDVGSSWAAICLVTVCDKLIINFHSRRRRKNAQTDV